MSEPFLAMTQIVVATPPWHRLLSLLDSNSRSPLAANLAHVPTSRMIPALDPDGPALNAKSQR